MARQKRSLLAIGQRLRRRRTERGLTQEALAHEAGITPSYLSQIERGERDFGVSVLLRLLAALGDEPSSLLVGADSGATRDPLSSAFERLRRGPASKRRAALAILRELDGL